MSKVAPTISEKGGRKLKQLFVIVIFMRVFKYYFLYDTAVKVNKIIIAIIISIAKETLAIFADDKIMKNFIRGIS